MLILTRKEGESIRIGDDIEVKVLRVGGKVQVGIAAPREITVLREEVWQSDREQHEENPAA